MYKGIVTLSLVHASDADGDCINYRRIGNKSDTENTAGKLSVPQGYVLGPTIMKM